MAIEAVIIDFDDTLCQTEEACFRLENETLRRIGQPAMTRQIHRDTWGKPLYEAISLRAPGVDPDVFWQAMPIVHEEFISSGQIDVVTEEALRALDKLAAMGKLLMILTSRSEVELRHILDPAHHLASRMEAFYHKDNMRYHKPDPRAADEIKRDFRLRPEQCAYVGDSPSDAAFANGAGIRFVASLESGVRSGQDFADYRVDRFIEQFIELPTAIRELDAA